MIAVTFCEMLAGRRVPEVNVVTWVQASTPKDVVRGEIGLCGVTRCIAPSDTERHKDFESDLLKYIVSK